MNRQVHKVRRMSWPTKELVAAQACLCSSELAEGKEQPQTVRCVKKESEQFPPSS